MIKLKNIISNLPDGVYTALEQELQKNKAENFLCLLHSYKNSNITDAEIRKSLEITSNSLYVLKSRLNDKIQEALSGDLFGTKENVIMQLHEIPKMCYEIPKEVADAFLQKLEKDLFAYDMHSELLVVYSALKKIHVYSDKYFHYSQLYNRHAAFNLSLEKCEEILGNFNRVLGQYNFARTSTLKETLLFLRKDICDHFALSPSRQTEIIKNLVELQIAILTHYPVDPAFNTEITLIKTERIINELPESSFHKRWITVVHFLAFEYYRKIEQIAAATEMFEKLRPYFNTLFLYSSVALTSRFFISKIKFFQTLGKPLTEDGLQTSLLVENDTHSVVLKRIYNAMLFFSKSQLKEAAGELNEILNSNSFKDFFHINLDVRLTLAYVYLRMEQFDLADNILKNLSRKIKSEEMENYSHILFLIKVFYAEVKNPKGKATVKQKDDFVLFSARNTNEHELLPHLMFELKKQYS